MSKTTISAANAGRASKTILKTLRNRKVGAKNSDVLEGLTHALGYKNVNAMLADGRRLRKQTDVTSVAGIASVDVEAVSQTPANPIASSSPTTGIGSHIRDSWIGKGLSYFNPLFKTNAPGLLQPSTIEQHQAFYGDIAESLPAYKNRSIFLLALPCACSLAALFIAPVESKPFQLPFTMLIFLALINHMVIEEIGERSKSEGGQGKAASSDEQLVHS